MLAAACRRHPRAVAVGGSGSGVVHIGLILSIVVLAYVGSVSANTSTTTVSFTVSQAIEVLQWPNPTFTISGSPGNSVVMGPMEFRVRANAPWSILMRSDVTDGRLREYDPDTDAYVEAGESLTYGLEWALSTEGPWRPVTDT